MIHESVIRPLKKPAQLFQATLIFLNAALNIIPQFKILDNYNFIWLFSMLTWFAFISLLRPIFFIKMSFFLKMMFFFMVYTIVIPYIFNNPTIGNRFLSLAQIPFFYFAYVFNTSTDNDKTNYAIIKWTIPLILYTAINTIIGLLTNPYSSRAGLSDDIQTIDLLSQVSAGYDFTYFIVFICIILFGILFLRKSLRLSSMSTINSLIIFIILFVNIILANYFTALIMLFTSLITFLLLKKLTLFKLFLSIIFIFIVVFWRLQVISYTSEFFNEISPGGMTSSRLAEIQKRTESGYSNDIADVRESTLSSSIKGFIENPILGMVTANFKIKDNYFTGFGQHSQFLDTLALYGLVGFLQIYFVLKIFLLRLKKKLGSLNALTIAILISVLIINIFNNITALIGFAYFFVYPTVFGWLYIKVASHKTK